MEMNASFWRGFTLGVGVMYLMDPVGGRRRRALMRDGATRALHQSQGFLDKAGQDLKNRIQGRPHEARGGGDERDDLPMDDVLAERVRAKLGHHVSHPRAVHADVADGHVTLRGDILREETREALSAVSDVPGVEGVSNELLEHDTPDAVPGLQGGMTPRPDGAPGTWTPGIQLLAGAFGVGLLALTVSRILARGGDESEPWDLVETPDYAPSA